MGYRDNGWYDDNEVDPPTLAQVKAANRKYPYEFQIEGYVDMNNNTCYVQVCNEVRCHPAPNNARAKRLSRRIFRRLLKEIGRNRRTVEFRVEVKVSYEDDSLPLF